MAEETEVVQEPMVQYLCRGCFGEMWLLLPFTPNFCCHCGKKLSFSGVEISVPEN